MKGGLLFVALLSGSCFAAPYKTIVNPSTGKPDYITILSTNTIQAGSNVTIVSITTGGVIISATGGSSSPSLPLLEGSTNYIQNRNTLQVGATAYPEILNVAGAALFSDVGTYGGASSAAVFIHRTTPAGVGTRLFSVGTNQQLNQFVLADREVPIFGIGAKLGSLTIGSAGNTQAIRTDQNTNKIEIWRTGTGGDMVLFTSASDDGSIKFEVAGAEVASFDNNGITFISSFTVTKNVNISSNTVLNGTTFYHGGNAVISQPGKQARFAGDISISSGLILGGSAGTSGQVVTSGGPDTSPTWTTIAGGPGGGGDNLGSHIATMTITAGYGMAITSITVSSNTYIRGVNMNWPSSGTVGGYLQYNSSDVLQWVTPSAGGTYTPTITNVANLTTITGTVSQYMRVGNVVTVSGRFTADPTLTATQTTFGISLPVASNFANAFELGGVAFCGNIAAMGAEINGDVANNRANVTFVASDPNSQVWSFTFTYLVI